MKKVKIATLLLMYLLTLSAKKNNINEEIEFLKKRITKLENDKQDDEFNYTNSTGSANWSNKTSIGGYGELHYNAIENSDNEVDFHRWVLFIEHQFSSNIRLISEFELEHALAGNGKAGEIELEQAYIEFDINKKLKIKTGTFLVPVAGLLNEHHEPTTFYGVERNHIENIIIPTTWWESGLAIERKWDFGLQLDVAIHSGLNVPTLGKSTFRIRSGRGKSSGQNANSLAYTARLKYTKGSLEVGAGLNYQVDITPEDALNNSATLLSAYVNYNPSQGFGFRGLYANWNVSDVPTDVEDADSQDGFYLEPAYKWQLSKNCAVGVYARYSKVDAVRNGDNLTRREIGINYWPIDNVVLKANLAQEENNISKKTTNIFSLGVGYNF